MKIEKPAYVRTWYRCECGKALAIVDNTAQCRGVFIKCKSCGKEIEIKIAPK